jgi:hypothetical protein
MGIAFMEIETLASFPVCALLLVGRESYRVIQAEGKDSFGWNAHLLALGEHLGSRSPGGADCRSDGCALSVTNYRTISAVRLFIPSPLLLL